MEKISTALEVVGAVSLVVAAALGAGPAAAFGVAGVVCVVFGWSLGGNE